MNGSADNVSQIVQTFQKKKMGLIVVQEDGQKRNNWLPLNALKVVSEKLRVPLIDVCSVASFYRGFSHTPRGKHQKGTVNTTKRSYDPF